MLHTAQQLYSHRRFLPHWAQTRHQAPLSQTVKEETISGALNLFDQKEMKRLTSTSPRPAKVQECSWAFPNTCSHGRSVHSKPVLHSESPRLESLLLKQAPLISTQDATADLVGFSPHTDYGMKVRMPFQVLLKSSTKIKLFSLLPLITVFISVSF